MAEIRPQPHVSGGRIGGGGVGNYSPQAIINEIEKGLKQIEIYGDRDYSGNLAPAQYGVNHSTGLERAVGQWKARFPNQPIYPSLRSEEARKAFINYVLRLKDSTNTLPYVKGDYKADGTFMCASFAMLAKNNLSGGIGGNPLPGAKPVHPAYRLPVEYVELRGTENGKLSAHAINAIFLGGDKRDTHRWYFFDPQGDDRITPSERWTFVTIGRFNSFNYLRNFAYGGGPPDWVFLPGGGEVYLSGNSNAIKTAILKNKSGLSKILDQFSQWRFPEPSTLPIDKGIWSLYQEGKLTVQDIDKIVEGMNDKEAKTRLRNNLNFYIGRGRQAPAWRPHIPMSPERPR